MDNQNTKPWRMLGNPKFVLILVLMDNQNTQQEQQVLERKSGVLILVLMDNQNTLSGEQSFPI